MSTPAAEVYLQQGKRRVFACAVDWPGWCRRDKTAELALEALARYTPRYAAAARLAGVDFPGEVSFRVIERLDSPSAADFGTLDEIPACDATPVDQAAAARLAALAGAAWQLFGQAASGSPAELRKGPRGGGRDRDKIIEHVLDADWGYARKVGVRHRRPRPGDRDAAGALRAGVLAVLATPSDGSPVAANGWPARYAARWFAWHALDHAWEIEDRG